MIAALLGFFTVRFPVADAGAPRIGCGALAGWLDGSGLQGVRQQVDRRLVRFHTVRQLNQIRVAESAGGRGNVGLQADDLVPGPSGLGECIQQYPLVLHNSPP